MSDGNPMEPGQVDKVIHLPLADILEFPFQLAADLAEEVSPRRHDQ